MKKLLSLLVFAASIVSAQTTVNFTNIVLQSNLDRPGVNLAGLTEYGQGEMFKSLNYANGAYIPGIYWQTSWPCTTGGTQSTTNWYNNVTDTLAYPANFWIGATFIAMNANTGTSYGSGTITASTANTGSTGTNFTLSPAISSACNTSNPDVLVVKLTAQNTLMKPSQFYSVNSSATFNTTDLDPASQNTQQSLQLLTGSTLTFYIDQLLSNSTNSNSSLASAGSNYVNINGSYSATFKAKCTSAGAGTINVSLVRGGTTFVPSTTETMTCNATPGAGWTTYTLPFTGGETGTQNANLQYTFNVTGTVLVTDLDVIEGSTLAGNTTAIRDSVVKMLQQMHPGSIRYMDGALWCSDVADEIATPGNRRFCGVNPYVLTEIQPPMGYDDVLQLGNLIGSDVVLSVGMFNLAADYTTMINWLQSSGWNASYAASGHKIYLEIGNEAWNSSAFGSLYEGNGSVYGYFVGPDVAAAKAASGYNSAVDKIVVDSWDAATEGYGAFGWAHTVLTEAKAVTNGLPDDVEIATYAYSYFGVYGTSGASLTTTGAPWPDMFAEIANFNSVPLATYPSASTAQNVSYVNSTFPGVGTLVYEENKGDNQGVASTQLQLNQSTASVGAALDDSQNVLLAARDAKVPGPQNIFALTENSNGYICQGPGCPGSLVFPGWGVTRYMAAGPGQINTFTNVGRPLFNAASVINNAIGSNSNMLSCPQSGTPTYNYPAGQPYYGTTTNSIAANSAVNYVNVFCYGDGANHRTVIAYNNNLTTTEAVTITGVNTPNGSVYQTIYPASGETVISNNENTYIGPSSISPQDVIPVAMVTSGTTYSIPAGSFITLTYSLGNPTTPASLIITGSVGSGII